MTNEDTLASGTFREQTVNRIIKEYLGKEKNTELLFVLLDEQNINIKEKKGEVAVLCDQFLNFGESNQKLMRVKFIQILVTLQYFDELNKPLELTEETVEKILNSDIKIPLLSNQFVGINPPYLGLSAQANSKYIFLIKCNLVFLIVLG